MKKNMLFYGENKITIEELQEELQEELTARLSNPVDITVSIKG